MKSSLSLGYMLRPAASLLRKMSEIGYGPFICSCHYQVRNRARRLKHQNQNQEVRKALLKRHRDEHNAGHLYDRVAERLH